METNNELKLFKAAEVAEILNVSRSLVYRLMQTGEIPIVRVNRSVRVRPVDLDGFIKENISRS